MHPKINCTQNINRRYCKDLRVKKTLFGLGERLCVKDIYDGAECLYYEEEPVQLPPGVKKPKVDLGLIHSKSCKQEPCTCGWANVSMEDRWRTEKGIPQAVPTKEIPIFLLMKKIGQENSVSLYLDIKQMLMELESDNNPWQE